MMLLWPGLDRSNYFLCRNGKLLLRDLLRELMVELGQLLSWLLRRLAL
jgi:hypothetical protein